jgi:hypothetical protein
LHLKQPDFSTSLAHTPWIMCTNIFALFRPPWPKGEKTSISSAPVLCIASEHPFFSSARDKVGTAKTSNCHWNLAVREPRTLRRLRSYHQHGHAILTLSINQSRRHSSPSPSRPASAIPTSKQQSPQALLTISCCCCSGWVCFVRSLCCVS